MIVARQGGGGEQDVGKDFVDERRIGEAGEGLARFVRGDADLQYQRGGILAAQSAARVEAERDLTFRPVETVAFEIGRRWRVAQEAIFDLLVRKDAFAGG